MANFVQKAFEIISVTNFWLRIANTIKLFNGRPTGKNSQSRISSSLRKLFYLNTLDTETLIVLFVNWTCMDSINLGKNQPKIFSVILIFKRISRKKLFIQINAFGRQEENKTGGKRNSQESPRAWQINGENYYMW